MAVTLTLPGIDTSARPPEEAERQKALSQFFTPPWLADEVASVARCRGRVCLEPSAGIGRIVDALLRAGARRVIAVEFDPRMVIEMVRRYAGKPVDVIVGDFLEIARPGTPDRPEHPERWRLLEAEVIAGNPPYTEGADTDHLAAIAGLVCEGREVSATLLCRTWALHSGGRLPTWKRLGLVELCPVADRVAFELPVVTDAGVDARAKDSGMVDVSIYRVVDRRNAVGAVRWIEPPK